MHFYSLILFMLLSPGYSKLNKLTHIKNGALQGRILKDRKGSDFIAFQSIPFAKPPIGKLRFKAPQPADNWSGVLEAINDVPVCLQSSTNGSLGVEDCLYLNVYTREVSNKTFSRKPVMFFIHGGSFNIRSSTVERFGPHNLMTEKIVLVTVNYRLGALGFLSSSDKTFGISSNNGLKDIVMALKWVQENIAQFGGNPERVTIFGESAGGVCVHYMILTPMAKGLFHAAIAQSGTAISAWAIGVTNSAEAFAKALGIDTSNSNKVLEELQKVSLDKILQTQNLLIFDPRITKLVMGSPTIEGPGKNSFLPDHPRNILKSGNYNKVPLIIGYTDKEGIMWDLELRMKNLTYIYISTINIPYYFNSNKTDEIVKRLEKFYYDGKPTNNSIDMIDQWTDSHFKYDAVKSAQEHAINSFHNVYLYEFAMDTTLNVYKRMNNVTATYPGAAHSDELGYLFHSSITQKIKSRTIEDISIDRMIKLWTNFAKFGNPTPVTDTLLDNQIWLPYKANEPNYMYLGSNLVCKNYTDAGYYFWKKLYDDYDVFEKSSLEIEIVIE